MPNVADPTKAEKIIDDSISASLSAEKSWRHVSFKLNKAAKSLRKVINNTREQSLGAKLEPPNVA